jgi:lactate racemase
VSNRPRHFHIPWGTGSVPLAVPQEVRVSLVQPREADQAVSGADQPGLVRSALESGAYGSRFSEFLASGDGSPIVCVVNDATRPTPTRLVLETLEPLFDGSDVRFLVATGSHRAPDEPDLELIFGPGVLTRHREHVVSHDSRDDAALASAGVTRRGTAVRFNRMALDARRLLLVNSVEPHYFAGYTGGRKSLFPGVAAFSSIEANHKLALENGAEVLGLQGNPVHEDALEALDLYEKTMPGRTMFSIQMVLDRHQALASVFAGDLAPTFAAAVARADRHFVVDVPEPADIVITAAAYPMDYDLYQSQKALSNGVMAMKRGGIIILVSRCRHGVGEDAFFRLLADSETPSLALECIARGFKLGYHKAAHVARIAEWGQMWAVTELPDDEATAAFMRPFPDLQGALDAALAVKGPQASVLILTDGSVTVPRVRPTDPV